MFHKLIFTYTFRHDPGVIRGHPDGVGGLAIRDWDGGQSDLRADARQGPQHVGQLLQCCSGAVVTGHCSGQWEAGHRVSTDNSAALQCCIAAHQRRSSPRLTPALPLYKYHIRLSYFVFIPVPRFLHNKLNMWGLAPGPPLRLLAALLPTHGTATSHTPHCWELTADPATTAQFDTSHDYLLCNVWKHFYRYFYCGQFVEIAAWFYFSSFLWRRCN